MRSKRRSRASRRLSTRSFKLVNAPGHIFESTSDVVEAPIDIVDTPVDVVDAPVVGPVGQHKGNDDGQCHLKEGLLPPQGGILLQYHTHNDFDSRLGHLGMG